MNASSAPWSFAIVAHSAPSLGRFGANQKATKAPSLPPVCQACWPRLGRRLTPSSTSTWSEQKYVPHANITHGEHAHHVARLDAAGFGQRPCHRGVQPVHRQLPRGHHRLPQHGQPRHPPGTGLGAQVRVYWRLGLVCATRTHENESSARTKTESCCCCTENSGACKKDSKP